jgi:hypothetical protein
MERMVTQPTFEEFKPTKLQVPLNRPKFVKGFPFEFELEEKMVQELGSFVEGSRNPTTQTSTPKFVEEVVVEVLHGNKAIALF